MSSVEQRLREAVESLEQYVALERQFAEGGENETVQTVNGPYPTLAALVAQGGEAASLLSQANAVLGDAQALRDDAANSAQAAANALSDAQDARDEAITEAAQVSAVTGVLEYHHGRALLLGGVAY